MFNNLGLQLSMTLKFYTTVEKGCKLKVRKFSVIWLMPTFVEVTAKTGRGPFCSPPFP